MSVSKRILIPSDNASMALHLPSGLWLGPPLLSPWTPQSIQRFTFACVSHSWGARGISETPPTAQTHARFPGRPDEGLLHVGLKHLTNAGLLWLFHVAIRAEIMLWRVATRPWGTEQPFQVCLGLAF